MNPVLFHISADAVVFDKSADILRATHDISSGS
jgi:hypothetical protein